MKKESDRQKKKIMNLLLRNNNIININNEYKYKDVNLKFKFNVNFLDQINNIVITGFKQIKDEQYFISKEINILEIKSEKYFCQKVEEILRQIEKILKTKINQLKLF